MSHRAASSRGNAKLLEGRYTSSKTAVCQFCQKTRNVKGFAAHLKKCEEEYQLEQMYAERRAKRVAVSPLTKTPKRTKRSRQPDPEVQVSTTPLFGLEAGPSRQAEGDDVFVVTNPDLSLHAPLVSVDDEFFTDADDQSSPSTEDGSPSMPDASRPTQPPPEVDSIKVEYHRSAGIKPTISSFEAFKRDPNMPKANLDLLSEPWIPFESRTEFEFAELAHEARLNRSQVTRLLELIKEIAAQKDQFRFKNSDDVDRAWKKAKLRHPTFSASKFSVNYKEEPHEFTLHSRSLWEWILQQVRNPLLAPHFHWDAQRLSKYDGETWVRFYDEPWTAIKFAQVQQEISKLNPRGKPLAIIIWADTSKLSTFGSQKGHFIVARIGNLPGYIRNGAFIGGGRIVGFVPIVEEDPREKKKPHYVDFKNAVYHEAFRLFLEDVAKWSDIGYEVRCGDDLERVLFPYIHIVSADYEEHCRFALNRGLRGLSPCPVCYIPSGVLSDLKAKPEFRIEAEAREIVEGPGSVTIKDEALKYIGMRNVRNAFWDIANTDIYEAVSFDRLHAYTIGLWKQHLFEELKKIVIALGRPAQVQFEEIIPRWSKLAHFETILNIEFADGNKWDDIAKITLHAAYQVVTQQCSPQGFALLRLIRKWIELNMLISFDVQTDKTLAAYDRTIDRFHDRLELYKEECTKSGDNYMKDWDGIIKVHSQTHASRDIRLKGVASNMDTKPNEKLNGAMRNAYHQQTNFRDVEAQLGKLEDRSMICATIRGHIDAQDELIKELQEEDDGDEQPTAEKASLWIYNQVCLKSRQRAVLLSAFVAQGGDDPAFINFTTKLSTCIRDLLIREYMDACESTGTLTLSMPSIPSSVTDSDLIIESRYITIDFESHVTWRLETDRLRCSPSFHGRPRYDSVIVLWETGNMVICKLVRVFAHQVNSKYYGLALVQPLNATVTHRAEDTELALCRVREKDRRQSVIIPIRSIIRGAVIVEDKRHRGEYTVVDTLDEDMYLRLMGIFPERSMEMTI
ncbi:hypothetical protein BDY19DRAFT_991694 [Irpex rosettiformis]|uniref:Uncharacterized protein n=1 Tax=Irpex rosettiformis TaxID=378272 RepID=A0ACB8UA43_9APHY|nr:hypothetical protein BDY19DRAFT_991694 [Irpex rosettiformis]